jgi:outer membrane immunogenic protein
MKQALAGAIAVAALAAGVAQAADMPVKVPVVPVAVFSWTGCYIGANGGWKAGRFKDRVETAGFTDPFGTAFGGDLVDLGSSNVSSGAVGGQAGCRWENSEHWVWGFEGEADWTNLHTTFTNARPLTVPGSRGIFVPGDTFEDRARGEWSAKLMFGHAWDRTLLYVTAGVGGTQLEMTGTFRPITILGQFFPGSAASGSKTVVGGTAGFGVAYALGYNWEIGAEYRYSFYSAPTDFALGNVAASCAGTICGFAPATGHKELTTNEILFRLNYRIGG